MNWTQASALYEERLTVALQVERHASHLAQLSSAGVDVELKNKLPQIVPTLERQLVRLQKGEFRIAVVGLEKAGKSTFVNAWLEYDLLPNDTQRCTFTTTQIYSVLNENEQRIEVYPKSSEEFSQLLSELQRKSEGSDEAANRARQDLDTINRHRNSLNQVIMGGTKSLPFLDLSQKADELQKYVADESCAHAIREVRIYTSQLASADGVVFFDVPGLNSGLAKHLEESRSMLEDCDAVICVQKSFKPSLEASEQKLVEFVNKGDEGVGIAGKLFVFLGQIDREGTHKSLERNIELASQDWSTRGELPRNHIIEGSAAAHLILKGAAGEKLLEQAGSQEDMRRKIASIAQIQSEDIDALIEASGISRMKERIGKYLREERVGILQKRCDQPISEVLKTAEQIHASVKSRFPEDPDSAKKAQQERKNIAFNRWWERKWEAIQAELKRFYDKEIGIGYEVPESKNDSSVTSLKKRYNSFVNEHLPSLPSRQSVEREIVFDKESIPVFDAMKVNFAWRSRLYDDVSKWMVDLAHQLSVELLEEAELLVDKMSEWLWGSQKVREHLLKDPDRYRSQLEIGFKTLFLRFARPITEALVRAPVGTDMRKEIVRSLGADIELIDNYYQGDEPALEVLKKYAKYGLQLLNDPYLRKQILGIPLDAALAVSEEVVEELIQRPASPEEVVDEVEADLNSLQSYLSQGVFSAAGFEAFRAQELGLLRDLFVEYRAIWTGVAQNEYMSKNGLLFAELPPELHDQPFDLEIAERLRQLRISLEEASQKGLLHYS